MPRHNQEVSVVIPAYNSADTTVETVDSVLAQTYAEVEVLVVDDGSTDHTPEAMARYGDRIRYIRKENGGACSARNLGIRSSDGAYVACLDCDDLWLPEKLERSLNALAARPEAAFVFSACYEVDAAGSTLGTIWPRFERENPYRSLLTENFIPAPTVVMRRSCIEQCGAFDESIFIPADWDLWLRLASEYPFIYLKCPLSKYRRGSDFAVKNIERSLQEALYVVDKTFGSRDSIEGIRKEDAVGSMFFHHAMLYRSAGEHRSAQRLVFRAARERGLSMKYLAHLLLSLCGPRIWDCTRVVRGMSLSALQTSSLGTAPE